MSPEWDGSSPADFKKSKRRKVAMTDPLNPNRIPPHSEEAERGVLACCLLDPEVCIGDSVAKLKAGPEMFYDLRHLEIYAAMVEMWDAGSAVDTITLQQNLKDQQKLEGVGGLVYLASLPDAVPSAANLSYYLEIVREKFVLRQMIATCTDAVASAYEHKGEVSALVGEVEHSIRGVSDAVEDASLVRVAKQLIGAATATIERLHSNAGAIDGIPTGLIDLDKLIWGLHDGEMFTIAARPSVGKSSIGMNIAEHIAVTMKIPVGVFSLEMTAESLMLRLLCSNARVNMRAVKSGNLNQDDFDKLVVSAAKIAKAPLYIDDSSGISILQLKAKARQMKRRHGIRVFLIDYLQLLHGASRKPDSRQQEITEISGGVKSIAKELKVPVIVLAQLNRDVEKRGPGAKPRISELRESGSIEQDSDIVGLLYRPQSEGGDDEQDAIPVNLIIAKQRNGACGEVALTFLKGCTRFESAAPPTATEQFSSVPMASQPPATYGSD